jgi:hypothetical protein
MAGRVNGRHTAEAVSLSIVDVRVEIVQSNDRLRTLAMKIGDLEITWKSKNLGVVQRKDDRLIRSQVGDVFGENRFGIEES